MNILFIGDIFASPGRNIVAHHLQNIISTEKIDLAIANAGGAGFPGLAAQPLWRPTLVITGVVLADSLGGPGEADQERDFGDAHASAVAAPSARPLSLRDHRVVRPARGDHVRLG